MSWIARPLTLRSARNWTIDVVVLLVLPAVAGMAFGWTGFLIGAVLGAVISRVLVPPAPVRADKRLAREVRSLQRQLRSPFGGIRWWFWNATASIDLPTATEYADLRRRYLAHQRMSEAERKRYEDLHLTLPEAARSEIERRL